MVKILRHYFDIVEGVITNTLVNRVSLFTAQSKQNDEYLIRMKAQIKNEESGLLTGFSKYAEYSNFNKSCSEVHTERNEFYLLNDKLRKYQQQAEKERRDKIIKQKQNRLAELIGYAKTGAEQYQDYIDIAQTYFEKMASKNASKLEKQSNALKLMTKRTI